MTSSTLRQAPLFLALSGTGWLPDTTVPLLLSGPGGRPVVAANMVSGGCASPFVATASSRGVFRHNDSLVPQGTGAPRLNAAIPAGFVVLGLIAAGLTDGATRLDWPVAPGMARLAATVLVMLALNFIIARFLLERLIGVRRPGAAMQEGVQ